MPKKPKLSERTQGIVGLGVIGIALGVVSYITSGTVQAVLGLLTIAALTACAVLGMREMRR